MHGWLRGGMGGWVGGWALCRGMVWGGRATLSRRSLHAMRSEATLAAVEETLPAA